MAVSYKDYYKTLGVGKDADAKAIKQAYRRIARKSHPDLKPGDKAAAERFREANEAYEVLSDPDKRRRYDELGADWARYAEGFPGGAPGGGPDAGGFRVHVGREADLGDFSEFFRTFFGDAAARGRPFEDAGGLDLEELLGGRGPLGRGGRGPRGARRGQDLETLVELSLEEAAQGATRAVQVGGRRVEIRIPAGVRDGSRVRAAGEGGEGAGGAGRGDLYLRVRVAPHALFERREDDLHVELPLAVWEAALGAEIQVPTLRGKVAMKVPPGTGGGRVFRLPGYGLPHVRGAGRGDQLVRVKIVVPQDLTPRERALFEELRQLRPASPRE